MNFQAFVRRRHVVAALLIAGTAALGAACGGSSSSSSSTAAASTNAKLSTGQIAVVGSQTITQEQLTQLIASAQANYKSSHRPFPKKGTAEYEQLQQQAIQQLVQTAQLDVGAEEMGVNVTPAQIQTKLASLKKQYFPNKKGGVDVKKYQAALKAQGLTESQLADRIGLQLREQQIYDKVTKTVTVTPADIQSYYNKNKKTLYTTPEQRHVRHILVAKKALANKIYGELIRDPAKFAALAKKDSKDPGSAKNGGDLGLVSKGQTVPPFDRVAFSIEPNIISHPVKTQFGWHIIEALGAVKPAAVKPLDKSLKAQISQQLESTKKQKAFYTWYQKLQAELKSKTKYATGYAPPAATGTTSTTGT
jgi:parvulin-like peptidyl-prolyl isomerase